jgi:hypothetical protein
MEEHERSPFDLDYSSTRDARAARMRAWFQRLPHVVIALTLMTPVWALRYTTFDIPGSINVNGAIERVADFLFYAALFLPGALRRINIRHALIMLTLAATYYGFDTASQWWPPERPFPYSLLAWAAAPVMVVGLAEWALSGQRTSHSLLWITVAALTVGCAVPLIQNPLDFTGATVTFRLGSGSRFVTPWGRLIEWPLFAFLTWAAIPVALKAAREGRRYLRFALAGVAAASLAAFLLFFHVGMYRLARISLRGDGPFSRSWSAAIFETRGSPSDFQAVWEALANADWSQPQSFYPPEEYRKDCVRVLSRIDRVAAARHLAALLRDRPSELLATWSADLLAEERRYEAVPELMRYALVGESKCTRALEAMNVPQAALPILRFVATYGRPAPLTPDFFIPAHERERLVRLLGGDAGAYLSDWTSYYDARAEALPTPLAPDVAAQTERVIDAMTWYDQALTRLYEAKCRLFVRRLEADGMTAYLNQLTELEPLLRGQRALGEADLPDITPNVVMKLDNHKRKAFADMAVTPPDWNVRGTDGLKREIEAYNQRVDAMMRRYASETTSLPETMPSTVPAARARPTNTD